MGGWRVYANFMESFLGLLTNGEAAALLIFAIGGAGVFAIALRLWKEAD
jgi:uncharacterized membrane protein YeaQ/YmgE (transglycosylase-associated protein family)